MDKILWPIFFFFYISSFGMDTLKIELTEEEKEWVKLNQRKNITIYMDENRGILNYHSNGRRRGVFPEIIKFLEKNTGLKFQVINEETNKFERSVDSGFPDIVMGVEDYKRNSKEYVYLEKSLNLDGVMITRDDYPSIDFKTDNSNKTIVCMEDDQIKNKILKKYGESVKLILKPTRKEAMDSLLFREADIYIEDYQDGLKYLIENPETEAKINYLSNDLETDYYIGGKSEYKQLLVLIQKLISRADITMKFFYEESLEYTKNKMKISGEIKKYMKEKKVVKVFIPKTEEIFQLYYIDEFGNQNGFLVNYFYEIEKILGLKIVLEESDTFSSSAFDINPFILAVNGKELNDEKLLSTEPYIKVQWLIFNRTDNGYISYIDDLEMYKIAVVEGSLFEKYLLSKGLKNNLVTFKTTKETMTAVSEGDADILIGGVQETNQFIKENRIKNIKVAGILPDKIDLRFGVPKKDEILFFMINGFNNDFSYGIKINKNEFFTKNTEIAKDYKFSIIILLISILGFLGVYIHLKKFKVVYNKLKNITIGLVETLESANTYNDEDTGAHIKRLNQYSELLAEELKLSNSFVNEIGLYASLHDIGKIGISDAILKKPGKLTEEEFEIMRTHIEIGYNLIKDLDVSPVASNIVRYHHEKWNGEGYGKGLIGEEIPVEARIVALADVYDALRQERVYKKAFTHEKSMEIIISESGKHFDPRIVEVFLKKHENFRDIFEKSKVDVLNKKNSKQRNVELVF